MKNDTYLSIKLNQLKEFSPKRNGDRFILSLKNCPNKIAIKILFILDEKVAALAGLMPDGSLIKDLRRIYFSQKKILIRITYSKIF
ncbi:MAG: hypothetical protein ABIA37_03350 [Candidatus Woesearchaeota archaeon]